MVVVLVILGVLIASNIGSNASYMDSDTQPTVDPQCKYHEQLLTDEFYVVQPEKQDEVLKALSDYLQIYFRKDQVICMIFTNKAVVPHREDFGNHYIIQYMNERGETCTVAYNDYTSWDSLPRLSIHFCRLLNDAIVTYRIYVDPQCKYLEQIATGDVLLVNKEYEYAVYGKVYHDLGLDHFRKDQVICMVYKNNELFREYLQGANYIIHYLTEDGRSCVLSYDLYIPPCDSTVNDIPPCPSSKLVSDVCTPL